MNPFRPVVAALLTYLVIAGSIPFFDSTLEPLAWWTGTALGMLAPALHLASTRWILRFRGEAFHSAFYLSLLFRTVLVLGLFTAILVGTKIGKISFTLSFIISYIFHSVIDIILIQRNEFNGRSNS